MLFPTMTFAVFFLVVLGVYWWLRVKPNPVPWKLFVLAASYVFYGWWDWRFCFLLAGSSLWNTAFGFAIGGAEDDRRRKWLTVVGVGGNLVVLGFFKYYGFFVESFLTLLRPLGLAPTALLVEITLPAGISFFTFCAISYLVDLRRRTLRPAHFVDIAVFLSFFPHLVAGPIVRASEFLPQIRRPARPDAVDTTRAARLIARGLFKKVVVANYLDQSITSAVFSNPSSYRSVDLLVGAYAFAVQIYADFSGYTDIAIGTALLMGIRFPENFNRPYTATTIQDFWHRWHMTLSRWLRDYLYIPLGGNRGSRRRTYLNLIITMTLGGLWHGASWVFVVWGLYHGVGLAVERLAAERRERPAGSGSPRVARIREELGLATSHGDTPTVGSPGVAVAAPPEAVVRKQTPWLGRIFVFNFVVVGWIFFRSDSVASALTYLWRLVTAWGSSGLVTWVMVALIAGSLAAQYLPERVGRTLEARASMLPPVVQAMGFGAFLLVCDVLGPQGVAPFIYFRF